MSDPAPPNKAGAAAPKNIALDTQHGVHVMRFHQERIDGNTVREMYENAVEVINYPNARMMVDFTGVTLINSGAMGMLVTIKKKCLGEGAQMHVVVPDRRQMEMFHVMNLQMVLNLFASIDDALRGFKPPAIQ